ncbi:MAG: hypothetical protein ACYC1A_06220 [Spirochaetales bacterium]
MSALFRFGAIALAILHLASAFLPNKPELPMAISAAAVLVPGLFLMSGGFRKAAIVFLAAGIGLLSWTRQPFAVWLTSINSMTNTVAIMVAMQTISIPVAMGRYEGSIRRWAERRFKSSGSLFLFSTFITHVLTSFLMLGVIPFSMTLLGGTIKARTREPDRFLAAAISRGYVLAALWAPGAINLYLVVQATGVAWSAILLPGIVLALLGLGLSFWMETGKKGVLRDPELLGNPSDEYSVRDSSAIRDVLIAAVAIVSLVLVFERFGIGSGYTRIMLTGCGAAVVWTLILFNKDNFKNAARDYWDSGLLKVRDMGPFFVAMGIFSGALESSGLLDKAMPAIQAGASGLGAAAVAVVPLVIVGLSLVGLHPFITIVLFGKILSRAGLSLPPLTIALSLAVGGAASYMISPFAGIIMSISRYTGAKASDIAIRWNWKFSLSFFGLGVVFALLWGMAFA